MLLAFFFFSLLMFQMTRKLFSDKIVLKETGNQLHISEIPFPAFTICPQIILEDNLPQFAKNFYTLTDDQ